MKSSLTKLYVCGKELSEFPRDGRNKAEFIKKTNYSLLKPVVCATSKKKLFCRKFHFATAAACTGF
ncbi:hypothetical protein KN63_02945 [Smithella sp. F21]|nr:hypothetical protein KN63_02945 [Smithella sp. F21]